MSSAERVAQPLQPETTIGSPCMKTQRRREEVTAQHSESSYVTDGSDDDGVSDITDYTDQTLTDHAEEQSTQRRLHSFLKMFSLAVASRVTYQIRGLLSEQDDFTSHGAPTASSRSHTSAGNSITTNPSEESTNKRKHDGEEVNRSNGNGSGDDPNKRQKINDKSSLSILPRRKFACPFYKRDPERHCKWRSCSGPGWDTIHRLK
jgi:hypothetical protein